MNGSKLAKVKAEFVHLSPEKQNQICEKVITFYFIMDSWNEAGDVNLFRQNCHAGGCEFVTDKHTDMPICSRKVVYIAMKTPALRGGYYDFVDGCFKLREVKPHLASPIILWIEIQDPRSTTWNHNMYAVSMSL